jgi:hypothetical protein
MMAVELNGSVKMHADSGPGVSVRVIVQNRRLRITSGDELVGDWPVEEIGIKALQDGFSVKVEGEEFLLRTSDDVALADEIGLASASPRLARRMATRHNPEEPELTEGSPPAVSTGLGAIGFALAGALVVLGGFFASDFVGFGAQAATRQAAGGLDFWLAFVVGGVLMVAAAFVMSISKRVGRLSAIALLVAMIIVFGFAVAETDVRSGELTAFGFVAGGLVVGVAVLASGSLREPD